MREVVELMEGVVEFEGELEEDEAFARSTLLLK